MPVDADSDGEKQDAILVMGRIAGPYGVKGWVRIATFTEHAAGLLDYTPWYLGRHGDWQQTGVLQARPHGKGLVAQLPGCTGRDDAMALTGAEIGVYRSQLPAAGEHEYYWHDLVGLQVITNAGRVLGTVDHLIETGANDVLVIKGEREVLVPFVIDQVVESVDLENRVIRVDWDTDY